MVTKIVALFLMIGALFDTVAVDVLVALKKFGAIFAFRSRRAGKKLVPSDDAAEKSGNGKKRAYEKRNASGRPMTA